MDDFVAYSSRWRLALLVLLGIAFVVTGAWIVGFFGPPPPPVTHPRPWARSSAGRSSCFSGVA